MKDFFKKIIISEMYGKKRYDDKGVIYMGLYNFLLDKDSLEK